MTSESTEVQFEYDKSVVGVDVELGSFEITPEQVKAYCQALDDTNPLYADGVIAPPGIFSSVSFGRGQALDAKVQFGNASFMAGQRMEFHGPVRSGQTYTAKTQVKEVYSKTGRSGTMVFVVRRTEFTDAEGNLVAASEQSQVHREVQGR